MIAKKRQGGQIQDEALGGDPTIVFSASPLKNEV